MGRKRQRKTYSELSARNMFSSRKPKSIGLGIMDEFWKTVKKYKEYAAKPPAGYWLNFSTYPWEINEKAGLIYSKVEIVKS